AVAAPAGRAHQYGIPDGRGWPAQVQEHAEDDRAGRVREGQRSDVAKPVGAANAQPRLSAVPADAPGRLGMTPRLWLAAGLLAALVAASGAGGWQQCRADDKAQTAALRQASERARKSERALQEKADGIRSEGEAARRRIAG